jgi:hypothetical protein
MLFALQQPVMVRVVVEQPIESTTVADVLIGAFGLTGALILSAIVLGAMFGGILIGAAMPSVLAEISFVTNKQDAALLKTSAYRQQIAEALFDAVQRYQQSLKKMRSSSSTAQTGVR